MFIGAKQFIWKKKTVPLYFMKCFFAIDKYLIWCLINFFFLFLEFKDLQNI